MLAFAARRTPEGRPQLRVVAGLATAAKLSVNVDNRVVDLHAA